MALDEGVHKLLRGRENSLGSDQCDHHLLCAPRGAHLHVAKEACPAVLVVDPDLEGLSESEYRLDDPVRAKVLQQAGFDRNHFVGARSVDAADRFPLLVGGKHAGHLIPVMIRILHFNDRIHAAVTPDQFLYELLLALCLLRVGDIDHRAAAALF